MNILFSAIVGSQSYGTATPQSDIDKKGIFSATYNDLAGFNYKDQIELSKDECYYELRRFLQLAQTANPTILELLYSPEDCILNSSKTYEILRENRHKFLTKVCCASFGGYAVAQIKKAKGLDKKMNYEKSRIERKRPLDFCYIYKDGTTIQADKYFKEEGLKQEYCGLVRLDHIKDCYALYYDYQLQYGKESNRVIEPLGYKGIMGDDSNEVRLSSVPKYATPEVLLYFNKDGYSMHCKDYHEYQTWLENRNIQRYVDTTTHGQKVDGKNLMHCRRLLDMAKEIALEGTLNVRRPNATFLLKIRKGEVSLEQLLEQSEQDVKELDQIYKNSSLPDDVDKNWVNELLLQLRYENNN